MATLKTALCHTMQYFPSATGSPLPYPTAWLNQYEYFLLFVTYPGCGVTCKPIFDALHELQAAMLTYRPLLIVNLPFVHTGTFPSESSYVEYYQSNEVSWPWVKLAHRQAVRAAAGDGIGGSCPRCALVHSTARATTIMERHMSMSFYGLPNPKTMARLKKMLQTGAFGMQNHALAV